MIITSIASMFLTLFSIDGKWKSYVYFFIYLSIIPKILTFLRNYCLIKAARFFPKTSSVSGYFLLVFLSKMRFFLDFSSSSLSHAVTFGTDVFWDGSDKIKQASSSSFLGGGFKGAGL